MKHAAQLLKTSNADLSERPALQGVKHYNDGSCATTDSHRLYVARDVSDKQDEPIIHPTTFKSIDGAFPNVFRLLEVGEAKVVYELDIDEVLHAADVTVSFAGKGASVHFKESAMYMHDDNVFNPVKFHQRTDITFAEPFAVNAQYLLDACKFLKDATCKTVHLQFRGAYRSLLIEHDNVTVLLLPVKIPEVKR